MPVFSWRLTAHGRFRIGHYMRRGACENRWCWEVVGVQRVMISRDGDAPIRFAPDVVEVDVPVEASGHLRLQVPEGWKASAVGDGRWALTPLEPSLDRDARVVVLSLPGGVAVAEETLRVDLDLRSSFDPARYALRRRNRASELGEVNPRRDIFERTIRLLPQPLRRVLFGGLYADIVFLRAEGRHRGGMCSGMARWALARGLGQEPDPATDAEAIERIQLYHGRQLRDRALLSAVPWFLRGSPKAAYRAVRRDLLSAGVSDRALDIAVPKLWRRDLLQALVAEGHTVVPYRLRQEGAGRAELEVYDPNHPAAIGSETPRTIHFDLVNDRYAYGTLVAPEQTNVGIIAVRQRAYATPGTAYIATIGSLLFTPKRGIRALLGRVSGDGVRGG